VYAVLVPIACFGLLVDAPGEEVRESRPVQLLVAALKPPEPPEQYREREEERDDRLAGDADAHSGGTDEGSDTHTADSQDEIVTDDSSDDPSEQTSDDGE